MATKKKAAWVTVSAFVFVLAFVLSPFSYAQTESAAVLQRRAQLQQDLNKIEAEIAEQQAILDGQKENSASIERDIAILNAEIKKAQLSIQARNIAIRRLADDIYGKELTIGDLNEKMQREKDSLAQLIRKTNEIDDYTFVEIILGGDNFSDFFEDLDSFDSIKIALNDSFRDIENTKDVTRVEKSNLEDKRAEELELRSLQELQKKKIEEQEDEKQRILEVSKGVEAVYQKVLREKEKTAAEIRTELFTLRGSAAIPFEKALALANDAGARTNVRPALILGIIAEESRLGEFIGTGNWRTDMHPTRDQPVFAEITARLGLDPDQLPVSKKPWYGWGGAMGPAQFIPSTWVLYEDRIAKATGHNPPNPWDPGDAFMASAILLSDNGADRGTWAAERLAALRYFAGWKNAEKSSYAFYGDEVMALAEKYQKQINILGGS